MPLFLKLDVVGPYSGIVYGRAGEPVEMVGDHDSMAIVKGAVLMPVRKEWLRAQGPEPATEPVEIKQQEKPVTLSVPSRKVQTRRPNNPTLF